MGGGNNLVSVACAGIRHIVDLNYSKEETSQMLQNFFKATEDMSRVKLADCQVSVFLPGSTRVD